MFAIFFWSFMATFTTTLAARTKLSISKATRDHQQGVERARLQEQALDFMRRSQS
jgi:deoxyribodipyrimidine photolyase-like uncharacterized protein